tara:strand:+ start:17071 stop:17532 length:462 start_codon:yes stop_codon:yes gene_type:complete
MKKTDLKPVVEELNILLADYHLYYQKLRNFHWNVKGHHFFQLHVQFEEMYNDSKIKIDEIAERILTLRFQPLSNYSDYLDNASLKESKSNLKDEAMMGALIKDNDLLLKQMRKTVELASEAGDEGTIDMLGAYIRELEKNTWMLESWTNTKSA